MSIQHIDEIPATEMVRVVELLPTSKTSIKMDGANLWFGIDQQGLYVSREGKNKSAGKIFSPGDFEDVAPNDQFKAALAALQAVKTPISDIIKEGDVVEVEVLFGSQPNVVKYHESDNEATIVFLRMVSGDTGPGAIIKLGAVLQNRPVQVSCDVKTSPDGTQIETETIDVTFNFKANKQYNTSEIFQLADLEPELSNLKSAMSSPSEIEGLTNAQLEVAKANDANKRQKINCILYLSKLKTALKIKISDLMSQKIDNKMDKEGFVVYVGENEVYKVVDKDHFAKINEFFQKNRKTAVGTVLTTDPLADPSKRGGIVGETKIQLAKYLGKPDFARAQTVNASMKELGKEEFLKQFSIPDLQIAKNKMIAIIDSGINLLNVHNNRFSKLRGGELQIGDSKFSYTAPVINRTKIANAEAFNELNKIKENVIAAKDNEELIASIFGRFIDLNTNIAEGKNMISYMLLEDEAPAGEATPTAADPKQDSGTTAGSVAPKDTMVGSGRYKFVMRKRNDSVLTSMKQKKLKVSKGK